MLVKEFGQIGHSIKFIIIAKMRMEGLSVQISGGA
jgi:hypothetical protein